LDLNPVLVFYHKKNQSWFFRVIPYCKKTTPYAIFLNHYLLSSFDHSFDHQSIGANIKDVDSKLFQYGLVDVHFSR
jgi:hypothetical protein